MEKEIIIKPTFVFKDYFKINLGLQLNKPKYLVYILAIVAILYIKIYEDKIQNIQTDENTLFLSFTITFLLLIVATFFAIYLVTKKEFNNTNYRLRENINYIINNQYLEEKGDSFSIKHYWKNSRKIIEKNNLFLLYITDNKSLVINKIDLKDNQYNELKQLFNSLNIKKSLK